MTSDDHKSGRDVKFRAVGTGMANTFACAACTKHRVMLGRRLARVMGLRTYVFATCAETLAANRKGRA